MGICPSRVTPGGCRCVWSRSKTQVLCLCWWRLCCLSLSAVCLLAPPNYRDHSTATRSVKHKYTFLHIFTCKLDNEPIVLTKIEWWFVCNWFCVLGTVHLFHASDVQYYAELAKVCLVQLWFRVIWVAGSESKEGQGMCNLISALFVLLTCTDVPWCRKEATIWY